MRQAAVRSAKGSRADTSSPDPEDGGAPETHPDGPILLYPKRAGLYLVVDAVCGSERRVSVELQTVRGCSSARHRLRTSRPSSAGSKTRQRAAHAVALAASSSRSVRSWGRGKGGREGWTGRARRRLLRSERLLPRTRRQRTRRSRRFSAAAHTLTPHARNKNRRIGGCACHSVSGREASHDRHGQLAARAGLDARLARVEPRRPAHRRRALFPSEPRHLQHVAVDRVGLQVDRDVGHDDRGLDVLVATSAVHRLVADVGQPDLRGHLPDPRRCDERDFGVFANLRPTDQPRARREGPVA